MLVVNKWFSLVVADYENIVEYHHLIPLKGFPQLKIQQEYKTKDLIATGNLTKEDIELPLENLLYSKFKREVDMHANEFPESPGMWRVTTEPEGTCLLLLYCY